MRRRILLATLVGGGAVNLLAALHTGHWWNWLAAVVVYAVAFDEWRTRRRT